MNAFNKEELSKRLTPIQFEVTQNKATERPFTGEYDQCFEPGIYDCIVCGEELFISDHKFDAGCGWPSFDQSAQKTAVEEKPDESHGMFRTEVLCAKCGAHLGHVFNDGPKETTGLRYCINSASLNFKHADHNPA